MNEYFYYDGQKQFGPYSLNELKEKNLSNDSLIWYYGLKDWTKAEELAEVKSILKKTPPPLPINSSTLHDPTVINKPVPPPLTQSIPKSESSNNVRESKENDNGSDSGKYIMIGLGLLLFIFLIVRLVDSGNSSSTNYAVEEQQQVAKEDFDSIAVATEKIAEEKEAYDLNELTEKIKRQELAEQKNAAERQEIIEALNSLKERVVGVDWAVWGGASNVKVQISNPTRFTFTSITVTVSYIKSDGSLFKTEDVTFYNVEPYTAPILRAPNSDRGTELRTEITTYFSDELPSDLQSSSDSTVVQ